MKQLQLHPAADVFCDHLLSEVEDENRKLRENNLILNSARDLFAKIELRLRDGQVVSTALKPSIVMGDHSEDYLSVPIDCDPRPLSHFCRGEVVMFGQNISSFPGDGHLVLGIRLKDTILLRFLLSKHCAVEGVLQGLSTADYVRFRNKAFGGSDITLFLTRGIGLQYPSKVTFTPTMVVMDISSELRSTLKLLLRPLPSHETIKNDLIHYVKKTPESRLPPSFPSSDELRISILTALGYTDSQMELLAQNYVLKCENCRLMQLQEIIGMVEISHPGFAPSFRFSLKDGTLAEDSGGNPVWRVLLTENVRSVTITNFFSPLAMLLVGMRVSELSEMIRPDMTQIVGDIPVFFGTFGNGTQMTSYIYLPDCIQVTLHFPLSSVQTILDVIGVQSR